ncbi:MAG: GDSL-type esterase/lipase family protein, partial [Candidatus Hodarchaeota archaeon]
MKILCIGDSHTAGFPLYDPIYGGNPESSYEYWLSNLLIEQFFSFSFSLDNKGICGQTTKEINQRLKQFLRQKRYNLVIYWGGANDIAIGYTSNVIWRNIEKAFEFTRKISVKCIIVTIPPMNLAGISEIVIDVNLKIKRSNRSPDAYIIADVYEVLEKQGNLNPLCDAGDGVHLSIEG